MPSVNDIRESAEFIRSWLDGRSPEVGVILGSGLGDLGDSLEGRIVLPYTEIPGFPRATATGHKGNLICGRLNGREILAMQGRFHYYEGYPMDVITFPERVMAAIGIKFLFVSCAVGGVTGKFHIGDLMLIKDHISFLPNPLIGPNMDEFGPRFLDMTCAYDAGMQKLAREAACEEGITLEQGILCVCTGPCYETPAEYEFFRRIGAEAVGMSTVPEVVVARHCGIRVLGLAVITDEAHNLTDAYTTDSEEIIRVAKEAGEKMGRLISRIIPRL